MKNIAIFASGSGTNFEALVNTKLEKGKIVLLVCNKPNAYVITRAKNHNIPTLVVRLKDFNTKEEYETVILNELKKYNVELILFAGYMNYAGNVLLDNYPNKIINIHPALLPSFKGAHGIRDAYMFGAKVMGVTVHYVDSGVDTGKIIDQEAFHLENETLEEAEAKIHEIEYRLYPKTLKKLLEE